MDSLSLGFVAIGAHCGILRALETPLTVLVAVELRGPMKAEIP